MKRTTRLLRDLARGTLVTVLLTTSIHAAPGYEYELIYSYGSVGDEPIWVPHLAINNAGEVVYTTNSTEPFEATMYSVYIARPGESPDLVIEVPGFTGTSTATEFDQSGALGINDDGVISVPTVWTEYDENDDFVGQEYGYRLIEPGVGEVGEIRGLRYSSGKVNSSLQMSGFATAAPAGTVVTDGVTTSSTPTPFGVSDVQLNDAGTVTSSRSLFGGQTSVYWSTPPGPLASVDIGAADSLGYTSRSITPGLNEAGWMTFVTNNDNSNSNPNPRVLVISPGGDVFLAAETDGTEFTNFIQPRQPQGQGVAINDNNRVAFSASRADGSESIFMGDATGDPPRLVVEQTIEFSDGSVFEGTVGFSDVTNISTNTLNNTGEITGIGSGSLTDASGMNVISNHIIYVARPLPGVEPGNPILPDPNDALPPPENGFRLRGRCPGECAVPGGAGVPQPRVYYDPPIAVGYDYAIDDTSTGAFESVLIPVALPGGDSEFEIEVNGAPAPLLAGSVLYFSEVTPDPVREFRISGIEQDEALDPDDVSAFVTGLTFALNTDIDVSFTMTPVVFDPTDSDSDGVPDDNDEFPADPSRSGDPDGDGMDSNVDDDDDGDGVPDDLDDYPWGRFDDAVPAFWSFSFIEALARAGITAGCGGGNYCPADPVTRAQMAVFLERGINGKNYSPPAPTGSVFLDVSAGDFAAGFIEQLFADGITAGCGNGNYCPNVEVSRAQMAVFLLRARYGSGYTPPAATGVFADVGPGDFAAAWIEQLASEGITAGCGNGNYCPNESITRAQMAVFLVRLFDF